MLRFLRKSLPNIRKRHRFLLKTVCLSAGIHIMVALIAIISMQFSSSYTFVVHKERIDKHTRIVLVPFARRVAPPGAEAVQKKETKAVAALADRKPKKPKKTTQPKASTTTVKKEEPLKPKAQPKKSEKKNAQKDKAKESTIQKSVKKADKTKVPAQEQAKPSVKKQEKEVEQSRQKKASAIEAPDNSEHIMYVGREDLKELQLHKTVCHAVQKNWQPPAGLPVTSACEISFFVGVEGTACNVEVVQSSKIVAYDIAARSAVLRARFDPYARGKKCTVVFKV